MEETEPAAEPIEPSAEAAAEQATLVNEEPPAQAEPVDVASAPEEPAEEPAAEQAEATAEAAAEETPAEPADASPVVAPPVVVGPAAARKPVRWPLFVALLAFTVLTLAAFVGDYVLLAFVPNGVSLLGREVSGLSDSGLRAAIDEAVAAPAMQPLVVSGDSRSWKLDPKGIVRVDVDAMVEEAYAPAHGASMVERLWSRVTGDPLAADVKPVYVVDKVALARWVAETAATVDREPVDATRTVAKYAIKITPEVVGATLDQTRAVDEISKVLTAEASLLPAGRIAYLPIETVAPKVVKTDFKKAIVVSLNRCKVYLYDGDKLVKTYRCAPGQPAWPTPTGDFVIVRKQANAPWINPGSSWAASMPKSIPGGPYNPMGDRKIGINVPGIFLHGIPPSEYSSIGTHASHGCMRMMPSDIHDLYPRVRIGNPVYIRH